MGRLSTASVTEVLSQPDRQHQRGALPDPRSERSQRHPCRPDHPQRATPRRSLRSLNLVLEGVIPIKIPCLDIDGLSLGSCTYDGDHLLEEAATAGICPTYFPEGQACALPLNPGVYGGGDPLVLGPIESVPDILLPFLKGTVRAEANFNLADGTLFACGYARVAVDH